MLFIHQHHVFGDFGLIPAKYLPLDIIITAKAKCRPGIVIAKTGRTHQGCTCNHFIIIITFAAIEFNSH